MKHAQRTEKYIRLIFNSYISDTSFFLEIFKAKRGCALCTNAHYVTLNTVLCTFGLTESYFLLCFPEYYPANNKDRKSCDNRYQAH